MEKNSVAVTSPQVSVACRRFSWLISQVHLIRMASNVFAFVSYTSELRRCISPEHTHKQATVLADNRPAIASFSTRWHPPRHRPTPELVPVCVFCPNFSCVSFLLSCFLRNQTPTSHCTQSLATTVRQIASLTWISSSAQLQSSRHLRMRSGISSAQNRSPPLTTITWL